MTNTTLGPPKHYVGSGEREAVSDSGTSHVYEGVQKQVEMLRKTRLENIDRLLQLGVLLESNRCVVDGRIIEAYSVPEAARALNLPVWRHPHVNTLWIVPGVGSINYGESMTGAGHRVEVAVRLHQGRNPDKTDLGELAPHDLVTLAYSGNSITAYESSQLVFNAGTRHKPHDKVRARCEIGGAYDGKGLELRIKIPESRAR